MKRRCYLQSQVERPAGLPQAGAELWERGVLNSPPRVGDLWVLSWDDKTLGHALLTSVREGFVLVWPVTMPGEPAFSPALTIPDSPLGVTVNVWPTRETGLGLHLLDRNLGRLLDPSEIMSITVAVDEETFPGYPFVNGSAVEDRNRDYDSSMIEHWRDLCFDQGPAADGWFLDSEKIKAHGGKSSTTADILGLSVRDLRDIWVGLEPALDSQVSALAESLNVRPADITSPDPWGEALDLMANPAFKQEIKARFNSLQTSETDFRLTARNEFALAARDDKSALNDQKMRDAIRRAGQ